MFLIYATIVVILAIIIYFKITFSYWKRKGLEQIEPLIPFGNIDGFISGKSWSDMVLEWYKNLKSRGVRHGGMYFFNQPIYAPLDLDIIKAIMVKDFDTFTDHGNYYNEDLEPLTAHLFNLEGSKWRNLRAKLSPTFTSGKMKMMYPIFLSCADALKEVMAKFADNNEPVDIKDILARFTTDIIGNCAFGIECNSMANQDSEFRKYGKKMFTSSWLEILSQLLVQVLPKGLTTVMGLRTVKKDVHEFFMNVVKKNVAYREENKISRPDFMQLLIQLRNEGHVPDDDNSSMQNTESQSVLTMNELAAQCFVFFIAGFETSSTAMTFALFELASNPTIQDRLRKEIFEVLKQHKELSYEAIMSMKYLDRVIQETLRKYPPIAATLRKCAAQYKVPGTDFILEKGTKINIFIHGFHKDPEYFPDPEKFDPDRFTEENKLTRPHFAWMPFGEGPRLCIGSRFALLQSKVGIIAIIRHYKLSVNPKTITPLIMDPSSFVTSAKGGIWLDVQKVE